MTQRQVLVIGGGPAGMIAACSAAGAGHRVVLIEKNDRLGRKLALTGNGRCNITNANDPETLLDHVVSNRNFLYSALYGFSNDDMIEFLHSAGLETKVESGGRIFPVTDRAADVIRALEKKMNEAGVQVRLKTEVQSLWIEPSDENDPSGNPVCLGVVLSGGENVSADVTILATGGLCYPVTGSNGDGLRMAGTCGHRIRAPRPALTPFIFRENECKQLQGRVFSDVRMTIADPDGNQLFDDTGDILFTHFGISGPMVLAASSYCTGRFVQDRAQIHSRQNLKAAGSSKRKTNQSAIPEKTAGLPDNSYGDLTVTLDFFPDRSTGQLEQQLMETAQSNGKKQISTILETIVPKALVPVLLFRTEEDNGTRGGELSKQKRQQLVRCMKGMIFHATGVKGYREAMITQGGIGVDEVDPVTMESRIIAGLRFAGEILDLDALTGGYNLQIAWSTGWAAGSAIE